MATTYGQPRFLYQNRVTGVSMITASSQAAGKIGGTLKTGTGSASMRAAGNYTGDTNILVTIQAETTGEIGVATYRWKTSDTVSGWEATGVTTSTTLTALGTDGKQIAWEQGAGNDVVAEDSWVFPCYALYGTGKLIDLDRDTEWRSESWETLVLNGTFNSDTSNWTASDCTLASVAGGQSGNCLEITRTAGDYQYAYQTITTEIGKEYIYRVYTKSGTSGNEAGRIYVRLDATPTYVITSFTTSSSWVQYEVNFVALDTSTIVYVDKYTATVGTMLFDTAELYEVPTFTFDITTAQSITGFALLDHNISSSATLTLKANSSDAWTSPAYSQAISNPEHDPTIYYLSESYRYWRVSINDPDNSDGYIRTGELYLGPYLELDVGAGIPWGSSKAIHYTQVASQSYVGKRRARNYAKQYLFTLQFPWLDNADLESLRTMYNALHDTSTGEIDSVYVHYMYDDYSTLYLCDWVNDFTRIFRGYDLDHVDLEFAEVIRSRI